MSQAIGGRDFAPPFCWQPCSVEITVLVKVWKSIEELWSDVSQSSLYLQGCADRCGTLQSHLGPWQVSCHRQWAHMTVTGILIAKLSYCLVLALTRLPTCCNTLHLQLNCPKEHVELFPIFNIFKANLFESPSRKTIFPGFQGRCWIQSDQH